MRNWRKWHRWIGLVGAIFFISSGVTGIWLECEKFFGAEEALRESLRDKVSDVTARTPGPQFAAMLTKALESDIPKKADEVIQEPQTERQLVLQLTGDGRYLLNREELTLASLGARLREHFLEPGSKKLIFVDADDSLPYGSVVQAMDLCRSAGAENIGIVTEPVEAPPGR